jgi:hypothetical protein
MPVPSLVSAQELARVAEKSYASQSFEVALVDAPGSDFEPDDAFATLIAGEVTEGLGGYTRQTISYSTTDIGSYQDGTTPLARKAATFNHNGNSGELIRFSHVVLISPSGTTATSTTKLASRATLSDGQSAIFYFDFTLYGVFVAS